MKNKTEIGRVGETFAIEYLEKMGYEILEKNFRCKQGEIDIIAYDKQTREIVFIEVKSRNNSFCGQPAEAVNEIKKKRIRLVAEYYLWRKGIEEVPIRLDVIEVFLIAKRIKQIKGCL